ncbi:MAG: hypothetical protein ABIH89_10985 [Elusimicrobiota bacterium]
MFIRLLFGNRDTSTRYTSRRIKIDNDIKLVIGNSIEPVFVCYTFGEENHKYLTDLGITSKLVDKRPVAWDLTTEMYRHKLEAFKLGISEYDKIVFLDWDCIATRPLPDNFWEKHLEKDHIQAVLRQYFVRKCREWRNVDIRKIPCASYLYLREDIGDELIKIWEGPVLKKAWSEERVLAYYTDMLYGGWKGIEFYKEHFEPEFFALAKKDHGIFPEKPLQVFQHYNWHEVQCLLEKRIR